MNNIKYNERDKHTDNTIGEHLDDLKLTSLIPTDTLQRLQDSFSNLTGLAALTTDARGVPVTQGSNFRDFCFKYTRTSKEGCKRCEQCDKMGAEIAIQHGHSVAYYCHAGLVDFAAPIMVDNILIGSFLGGQVLTSPPDYNKLRDIAAELDINYEEYKVALSKVNIIDDQTISRATEFIYVIAGILSYIAYDSYKLRQSNLALEKASRAKSDFLANMSHEIRTPMNAVLGLADIALREDMTPLARAYLSQIKASGRNLLAIINDILDFSKVESGKMEIIEDIYEPYSLCNDLSGIVTTRIGEKDIEFIMDISPELPNQMFGDSVRIHQVILNLLTNAVKYTVKGSVKLSICVKEHDDEYVTLLVSVSDTGIGIKPEDKDKLFLSFQRVDSKRNRNIEGTGLGLPLSNQLLRLMGSQIQLESEYNKGSTFFFELKQKIIDKNPSVYPLKNKLLAFIKVESECVRNQLLKDLEWIGVECIDMLHSDSYSNLNPDFYILEKKFYSNDLEEELLNMSAKCILIEEFNDNYNLNSNRVTILKKPIYFLNLYNTLGLTNIHITTNEESADIKFLAPNANILIVDDNPINLTVAKGLIEPLKSHVDTADGAMEAIDKLKSCSYDIIFMDHMMPKIDGIEATHMIREQLPTYNTIPIIALTANAISGAEEMFLNAGMDDFIAKPIQYTKLISKIKKWLPDDKIELLENDTKKPDAHLEDPIYNILELNVEAAVNMLGSLSLFKNVLKEYYFNIDKKAKTIQTLLDTGDIDNFTITVHSLKSLSRQIGAEKLSMLAASLEKAGNEHDIDFITKNIGAMLDMYLHYKDILAPYFCNDIPTDTIKTNNPHTLDMLDNILSAVDSFDTLLLDENVAKMDNYTYSKKECDLLDQLKEAAEIFDVDIIIKIITQWKEII